MIGSLSEMAVLGTYHDCSLLGQAYTQALKLV
jgi:hypothetical protein